jgi:hypothetical protein
MTTKIKKLTVASVLISAAIFVFTNSCNTTVKTNGNVVNSPWYPEKNEAGDPVLYVFESRVPCSDCERIKLALAIYGNQQSRIPTTYQMARVYVGKSNDRLINKGNLTVKLGTALDSSNTVYQLATGAPVDFQNFWKINDSILFVLDDKLNPKVGNAGQGYVINRVK